MTRVVITPQQDGALGSAADTVTTSPAVQPDSQVQGMADSGAPKNTEAPAAIPSPDEIRKAIREELSAFQRAEQTRRDRFEQRVKDQVAAYASAVKTAGVELTPEVQKKLEQQARQDVLQAQDNPPANLQPQGSPAMPVTDGGQQTQPNQAQPTNQLEQIAYMIMDTEGIDIEDVDPEVAMIDWTSPTTVKRSVDKAVEAKRQRLAQAGLPVVGNLPANPNPIANVKDPDELWALARKGIK